MGWGDMEERDVVPVFNPWGSFWWLKPRILPGASRKQPDP